MSRESPVAAIDEGREVGAEGAEGAAGAAGAGGAAAVQDAVAAAWAQRRLAEVLACCLQLQALSLPAAPQPRAAVRAASSLLELARRLGVPLPQSGHHALLEACARCKRPDLSCEIFEQLVPHCSRPATLGVRPAALSTQPAALSMQPATRCLVRLAGSLRQKGGPDPRACAHAYGCACACTLVCMHTGVHAHWCACTCHTGMHVHAR